MKGQRPCPFLYLFICKDTNVGGGLLAKGIFPICQYGAVEESQVFTYRVMKLELGTTQTDSPILSAFCAIDSSSPEERDEATTASPVVEMDAAMVKQALSHIFVRLEEDSESQRGAGRIGLPPTQILGE